MKLHVEAGKKPDKPRLSLRASKSVNLLTLFEQPLPESRPSNISPESWTTIQEAVSFVHLLEISFLDELITSYVAAIIRAEGCKCLQCRKRARILSEALDDELERQTAIFGTNSFHNEERELIERDIELALWRLKEKEIDAQDDRWEKLRELLQKVRKDSDENRNRKHLKLSKSDELIKQQLLKEVRELREKRRRRKN